MFHGVQKLSDETSRVQLTSGTNRPWETKRPWYELSSEGTKCLGTKRPVTVLCITAIHGVHYTVRPRPPGWCDWQNCQYL